MNDLVTIITPFYNSREYFGNTFKSVISQTFTNWEWIIVDDCSTDGSSDFLKGIEERDSRIRVIFSEKNGGSAVARNIALGMANGRYITFLDSDDILDENYLQSQVQFIRGNGPIITAGYRRDKDGIITTFMPRDSISFTDALKGNDMSCLTTMYDRTVIGEVRFHEDFIRDEDYVFWLEILNRGILCKTNKEFLATYILRDSSKNSRKIKLLKSRFKVYHDILGYNVFKSMYLILNYYIYGKKKYKGIHKATYH